MIAYRSIPALTLLLPIAALAASCGSEGPPLIPTVAAQIATPTTPPTPIPTPALVPTATTRPAPTPTEAPPPAMSTPTPQETPLPHSASNIVRTLSASKDNTIYDDALHLGLLSNGSGAYLFAGNNLNSDARRGLIAFDIAGALPVGAAIQSVRLSLHISQTTAGPESVALYRLLADWREGATNASANEGGGGTAQGNDATWSHAFGGVTPWETLGGDFESTASASAVAGSRDSRVFWESDDMAEDVQSWLEDPEINFGWMLVGNEGKERTAKRFNSRQNAEKSNRPVLTVVYKLKPR